MSLYHRYKPCLLVLLLGCLACALLVSCGGGNGAQSLPTTFEGNLVDSEGAPITDATIFIFDTNEAAIVDENGAFLIESFRHLTSVKFFTFIESYSNTVEIDSIPDEAALVNVQFKLDRATNTLEIISVTYENIAPPQSPPPGDGSESSSANSSESVSASESSSVSTSSASSASSPASSGASSDKPTPTPTPKPGNFDENGNTTAFGIPSGLKGNINAGKSVWNGQCQSCHASEKTGRNYNQIKGSFRSIPQMQSLKTSNQQIADVTAYLNRGKR